MMNKEDKVTWKNENLIGEGLWLKTKQDKGAIICHPHPQMGGSMYNNVVETIRDVFAIHGFATLRFNFRGVGGSTGRYDEGKGEKQDVLAACEFMKSQGIKEIAFSGYSFGAWIGTHVIRENPSIFKGAYLISPPDKFSIFDWHGLENLIDLIVCGKLDPFCDIKNLQTVAEKIHAKFEVLESVDHFYAGYESQLASYLNKHIGEKNKNI